jgi:hypothetical protein
VIRRVPRQTDAGLKLWTETDALQDSPSGPAADAAAAAPPLNTALTRPVALGAGEPDASEDLALNDRR